MTISDTYSHLRAGGATSQVPLRQSFSLCQLTHPICAVETMEEALGPVRWDRLYHQWGWPLPVRTSTGMGAYFGVSQAPTVRRDAKVGRELGLTQRECFNQNGGGQGVPQTTDK